MCAAESPAAEEDDVLGSPVRQCGPQMPQAVGLGSLRNTGARTDDVRERIRIIADVVDLGLVAKLVAKVAVRGRSLRIP